jgi:threonine dehydrogenase-like Zn-dependent dehydrogenase
MLNLKGIYGREMFETWYKMIAFVQGGLDLSPIITHRIGIDDFRDGFEAMRSGKLRKSRHGLVGLCPHRGDAVRGTLFDHFPWIDTPEFLSGRRNR